MNEVEICVCSNSNSIKYIYGKSKSGNTRITKLLTVNQEDPDILFHEGLFNSSENKSTIILFNDMKSVLSPTYIMTLIEEFLKIEDMDILYLHKCCDVPSINEKCPDIDGVPVERVISPHGIKALLITPNGKAILRNVIKLDNGRGYDFALNAYCEKIRAYSTTPCIFYSDDNDVFDDINDREKIETTIPAPYHSRNKSTCNLLWFIFVVIIVLIAATMLLGDTKEVDGVYDPDIPLYVDHGSGLGPFDGTGDMKVYRIP